MKKFVFLSILTLGIFLLSCEKEEDKGTQDNFKFEATVLYKGMDCGEVFILYLKNLELSSELEDGYYYADNLGSEYKKSGLKIYLNCREPNDDERYVCTHLGPTHPHLIVINSSKVEE